MKKGARYPETAVDFLGGGSFKGPDGELPSPVVLMGDSVTLFPANHADEQNLRAHLAHHCGVKLEHLTSMGGSAQAGRLLAREGAISLRIDGLSFLPSLPLACSDQSQKSAEEKKAGTSWTSHR